MNAEARKRTAGPEKNGGRAGTTGLRQPETHKRKNAKQNCTKLSFYRYSKTRNVAVVGEAQKCFVLFLLGESPKCFSGTLSTEVTYIAGSGRSAAAPGTVTYSAAAPTVQVLDEGEVELLRAAAAKADVAEEAARALADLEAKVSEEIRRIVCDSDRATQAASMWFNSRRDADQLEARQRGQEAMAQIHAQYRTHCAQIHAQYRTQYEEAAAAQIHAQYRTPYMYGYYGGHGVAGVPDAS